MLDPCCLSRGILRMRIYLLVELLTASFASGIFGEVRAALVFSIWMTALESLDMMAKVPVPDDESAARHILVL